MKQSELRRPTIARNFASISYCPCKRYVFELRRLDLNRLVHGELVKQDGPDLELPTRDVGLELGARM